MYFTQCIDNKIKIKYHTIPIIPKSNIKIVERVKSMTLTEIIFDGNKSVQDYTIL